jgi:serine/threonine-protein kinase
MLRDPDLRTGIAPPRIDRRMRPVAQGKDEPRVAATLSDPELRTRGVEVPASVLPPPAELERGDQLDQFTIVGRIGVGAMGTVYRARDRALGRDVAVKLIRRDLVDRPRIRAAFESEARAMASVRHPNVVTIHAFGERHQQPYIVMEYVRGVSLATWRDARRRIDVAEALAVLDPLCRGVAAIHASGTLHRDLKPGNVLVEPNGRVAVTDFGLAHPVAEQMEASEPYGTPAYLAPEIAREESIAPALASRADVYALAVVAFELLTGQRPFPAATIAAMLEQHAFAPPPRPSSVCPELPTAFDAVLLRALAKSPASRTPSAESFRRELLRAHDDVAAEKRGLRVLIVDDDSSASSAICSLLRDTFPGAEVVTTSRTTTAIELATAARPDLVIADLHMPDGGAMTLTSSLRGNPSTATVPIIVVTGHGGAQDWAVLRELGADRFLVKPVDFDALAAMIRAVVSDGAVPR